MNVNGSNLDRRGGQFDTVCEVHKEVQADIMCGQEHNLDSDQTYVRSILYSTCRHHWRRSRVIFGTTPIPFTNSYKPGGTFMLSAGDVTGRMKLQNKDKWGRWVSQTLQGRDFRLYLLTKSSVILLDKVASLPPRNSNHY